MAVDRNRNIDPIGYFSKNFILLKFMKLFDETLITIFSLARI